MTPREPDARTLFEILVRDHARELDLFLRAAVREPSLVDDLFQETLLVAWRRLVDFDRTRPFGPWLRGIGARLALDARRTRSVPAEVAVDEQVLEELDRRCAALRRVSGDTFDERIERLHACLDRLPAPMRSAVDLFYAEDLRGDSLADRLATSVGNSRKLLQRARERLADCIDGQLAAQRRLS